MTAHADEAANTKDQDSKDINQKKDTVVPKSVESVKIEAAKVISDEPVLEEVDIEVDDFMDLP